MATGGHPPPEYAQKSLYVQQPSLRAGVFMVHQHYGTQTVNRGAVMPGMLVKHKDGTWTASANLRGRLYLHRGIERTYTRDLLVEVFLDLIPFSVFLISLAFRWRYFHSHFQEFSHERLLHSGSS
ncbi:hypothetical protein [Escherichia coli]|uniref:hypothetical protein n=1 Tax=Escherichia coli TaxID=562 RepID=UPI00207B6DBC|nr:hypothetical protein [Escherichia coli]